MKDIHLNEASTRLLDALANGGAFLNVQDKQGNANVMTIGWAYIGQNWGKPCLTVHVRKSRHSHHMLVENPVFTVSVPNTPELAKELALCGVKSGRDMDKYSEAGLTAVQAKDVDCKIIKQCPLQIECRVVYTHEMNSENLEAEMDAKYYPAKDYHTMFFGEITSIYEND